MDNPSFAPWLATHRRGELDVEVGAALGQLIAAAQETGKSGTLTLTLAVKAAKPGARTVTVTDKVVVKIPEHSREDATYFVGPEGTLVRHDPDQLTFDEPVRRVDPATGEISETPR